MTSSICKIQECLSSYSWLKEKGKNCILSPDCDGFLCGLFMSYFFDWKIKGYYDGKVLIIESSAKPQNCVFLDMEICRPHIHSIGQHMLYYNVKRPPHPSLEEKFRLCLSPNNIRGHDFHSKFMQKYPFGTIHLLMALLPHCAVKDEDRFAPLFYVDGTFKNLLNYPENCLDWLQFMDSENNALKHLFHGSYPFSRLMVVMRDFFSTLDAIGRRADKMAIRSGDTPTINKGALPLQTKEQAEAFLSKMGDTLKWPYQPEKWAWENFASHEFESGSIVPGLGRFQDLMGKNPISWAIISRSSIEYTLDNNQVFGAE